MALSRQGGGSDSQICARRYSRGSAVRLDNGLWRRISAALPLVRRMTARSGNLMKFSRTVAATIDAVLHESDGVRVSSPYSCIEMAYIQLQAAQYQLWSAPQECTPARLNPIADASYRAMTALASVISCLAATDVNATRRAALDHSRTDFEVALATLRDALGEHA